MSQASITIRLARRDEQAALEALQRRASLANPGDREVLIANPDAIVLPAEQLEQECVFVAECGETLAGFAAVVRRTDGSAELDGLFVEPRLWRRGIGQRLVHHVAAIARGWPADRLHVVGNPHAEAFYTACGFTATGVIETRFGSGLDMTLALTGG